MLGTGKEPEGQELLRSGSDRGSFRFHSPSGALVTHQGSRKTGLRSSAVVPARGLEALAVPEAAAAAQASIRASDPTAGSLG